MPPLVSSSYITRLVAPQKWLSTRGLQFSVPIFSCLVANRVPLAQVVEDCVRRWFQDTLKEAKSGDVCMQVLVGQMYSSCYGIPKGEHKVIMQVIQIPMIRKIDDIFQYFVIRTFD
ncbi:hypothetical protein F2Q69_00000225 [Brassica cretica]|uniref:Uncharacterized protein n=1 Tax=Brassica cretica TaxID=69181 RepID=A0A8S9P6Z9_BRACR|nr:hypothetical protein F2Q69_00000225 [Brassica cretica]